MAHMALGEPEADMAAEEAEALATKPLGRVAASHLVEAAKMAVSAIGIY